jgi:hypothetical protein
VTRRMIEPLDQDTFMAQMRKSEQAGELSERAIKQFWSWMYGSPEGAVQVCAFPVPAEGQKQHELGQGKWIQARTYDEFYEFCDTHSGLWRYHTYAGVNTLDEMPEQGRGKIDHIDKVEHLSFDIETETGSYEGASKEAVWWSYQYALAEVKFMMENYGVLPMVVMSENGIHLHFNVDFEVRDELLLGKQHLYSKYLTHKAMESEYVQTIEEKSPDHITFDQDDVSDPPRVMKVPGTRGIKSETGRLCGIIHQPSIEDAGVITEDQVTVTEDEKESLRDDSDDGTEDRTPDDTSPGTLGDDVKSKISRLCKNDSTFKQYWNGNPGKYDSRSEAEFAFVLKMLNHDFTVNQIVDVMWASGMVKWDEESEHYRERTIDYALDYFDGTVVRDSNDGSYSFSST